VTRMRILVVGASGFIGSRVTAHLHSQGHRVICAGRDRNALGRRFPDCETMQADFREDDTCTWRFRLARVDAVVNAVGLLRGDLERVHRRGPVALFEACAEARVSRVLQISALGAGRQPGSRFLATKNEADAHLLRVVNAQDGLGWCVLRPSLVIGRGGASTDLFCALAAVRLGAGRWRVQPIHVEDLVRAISDLLAMPAVPRQLDMVGPEEMTADELTAMLRSWLGLAPGCQLMLPRAALLIGARIGDLLPGASLTRESVAMLEAGNTADPAPMAAALGWMPRRLAGGLATEPSVTADLWRARLLPVRGILIASLVAIWVGAGLSSFLLSPRQIDHLLAGFDLSGEPARAITWAGAALDVVLGLLLLRPSWRRTVLDSQLVVMVTYTALATIALPALWADPFGALLKNFGVLAAILALRGLEDRP
jgi:uncharacterized protein YbjT (DUF2867 family)